MGVLAIELNDAGFITATEDTWRDEGPGYALLDPDRLLLGNEARSQARLRPRRLNTRFWSDLSTEAMPRPEPYARSHADLACAQLGQIWERRPDDASEALFVVPGFMARNSLGLVLGIAAELGIPVAGMVDAAVAASTLRAPGRVLAHLDVHLHAAILTRLEQGAQLERSEVELFPAAGQQVLEDAWARAVAGAFVAQTRFDPLHAAGTDQALHDELRRWLTRLGEAEEVAARLTVRDRPLEARLGRDIVLAPAAEAYQAVAAGLDSWRRPGTPVLVQLSDRAARLPGLLRFLDALPGVETRRLEAAAPGAGALARRQEIPAEDGQVRFVTRLSALDSLEPPVACAGGSEAGPAETGPAPSHLLLEGEAVAIGAGGLAVGLAPPPERPGLVLPGPTSGVSRLHFSLVRQDGRVFLEDHSRYGTFVNESRVRNRLALQPGDRIRVGAPGVTLRAIRVRDAT
ncbi:MAG: FHA domain-containing protein [Gammaproteobacteria bacterium]